MHNKKRKITLSVWRVPAHASRIFTNLFFAEAQTFFVIFATIDVAKSLTTWFNSSIVEGLNEKHVSQYVPRKKIKRVKVVVYP